ncbi:mitochondrial ribosomal small subunit component [Tilletia horrida]|nr:mitochondrial ribosomal small subunit component [Tilletia horrida]
MSRKIAGQVSTNVGRLLRGGYLKEEPVWYQAVVAHPPMPPQPRSPIPRPADDLPPGLTARRENLVKSLLEDGAPAASSSSASASADGTAVTKRARMSSKRLRALVPDLHPQPIFYLQDRVRRQFYRDHPWEAYRPRTLVEMDKVVVIDKSTPLGAPEDARELRAWGRNPGPEEVVACTVHLHQQHGLSLSQAYHHTIASYHALRAEHETASRFAVLEAEAYGANMGMTETTRNFLREHRRIFGTDKLEDYAPAPVEAASGAGQQQQQQQQQQRQQQMPTMISLPPDQAPVQSPTMAVGAEQVVPMYIEARGKDKVRRVKNVDDTFTAGDKYLEAAFATSQAAMARLRS